MYRLEFSKKAKKFIQKQDSSTKNRIKNSLLQLAENPFDYIVNDIKKLKGFEEVNRLRVGDLRILYMINEEKILIFIVDVGNRGDIYKKI